MLHAGLFVVPVPFGYGRSSGSGRGDTWHLCRRCGILAAQSQARSLTYSVASRHLPYKAEEFILLHPPSTRWSLRRVCNPTQLNIRIFNPKKNIPFDCINPGFTHLSPCRLADSEIRTPIAPDSEIRRSVQFANPTRRIGGAAFLLHCLALPRMSVTYLTIVRQECRTSYIDRMPLSGAR